MYKASVSFMIGEDKKVFCNLWQERVYTYIVTQMYKASVSFMLGKDRNVFYKYIVVPEDEAKNVRWVSWIKLKLKNITDVVPEDEAKIDVHLWKKKIKLKRRYTGEDEANDVRWVLLCI